MTETMSVFAQPTDFSADQWDHMTKVGFRVLERLARARSTISYSEFCRIVGDQIGVSLGYDSLALHRLLERVARHSHDRTGVVLTALVRRKDSGYDPGAGFYAVCRSLGLIEGSLSERRQEAFVIDHQRRIEAAYSRPRSRLPRAA